MGPSIATRKGDRVLFPDKEISLTMTFFCTIEYRWPTWITVAAGLYRAMATYSLLLGISPRPLPNAWEKQRPSLTARLSASTAKAGHAQRSPIPPRCSASLLSICSI